MNPTPLSAGSRCYHLDFTISIAILSFVCAILLYLEPDAVRIHPVIDLSIFWVTTFVLSFVMGALMWFIAILFRKASRKLIVLFKLSAIACITLFIYSLIAAFFLN